MHPDLNGEDDKVMKLKNEWDKLVSDCEKKLTEEGDEDASIDFKVLMNSFLAALTQKQEKKKKN